MKAQKEVCVLCAWRGDCNKKFSISGRDMRCPDFARDLKIKGDEMPEGEAGGGKNSMPGFVMSEKKKYNSQHKIGQFQLDSKKPGFPENKGEEFLAKRPVDVC